jgi:flagellar protein FliO/FliZ
MTGSLTPLLWFVVVLALIPAALWLLKRSPVGGGLAAQSGLMRHVATLPLAPNQKLVTVEVGSGESRRWLVLGVTAQSITTLHTMEPQGELPAANAATPPFAQLLQRMRQGSDRAP